MPCQYSSAENRTPVSRLTGGDTHHYTTEDLHYKFRQDVLLRLNFLKKKVYRGLLVLLFMVSFLSIEIVTLDKVWERKKGLEVKSI